MTKDSIPAASSSEVVNNVSDLPLPLHLSRYQVEQLSQTLFPETTTTHGDQQETQKLSGRPVFVPFSTQAFVMGTLQPQASPNGLEQVQVRLKGSEGKAISKTVSTQVAKQWLQQSSESMAPKEVPHKKQQQQQQPQPTAPKSGTPAPKKQGNKPAASAPSSFAGGGDGLGGSFVEIHEEYHPDGKQVKGEVVDVSQQLNAMLQHLGEPGLPPPESPLGGDSNNAANDSNNNNADADDEEEEAEAQPKPLSDQEYDQLSKRLEELARLEEEAAKPQKKTTRTKKATASGWKKGFLDSKPKTKKAQQPQPQQQSLNTGSETPPKSNVTQNKKSSSKGVSFDPSQNNIQEIPRIGNNKVPPKQNNMATNRRTLDPSMFSGVIQERNNQPPQVERERQRIQQRPTVLQAHPRISALERQQHAQEQQQPGGQQQTSLAPPVPPKPKRLSRFAQERQGLT